MVNVQFLFLAVRMEHFTIILVVCMATLGYSQTFNVTDYGAVGDGKTDDSQAFGKAWKAACEAKSDSATLNIPNGKTFLLKPMRFNGPCNSATVHVQVEGNIVAPSEVSNWSDEDKIFWLGFKGVNGLIINGNGQIDGLGANWWKSCPVMHGCRRPTALHFVGCTNLQVMGLTHINSPRNHITITHCDNATISDLHIYAPDESRNTDGIVISSSRNIQIRDSTIATGDDCIAILTGCSYINITGVICGPGHGISVGSLGKHGDTSTVEEVHVKDCVLNSTTNGVRIKTWQGGRGYAKKISFENITLISAKHPIIIDQYYCDHHESCHEEGNAVQISDVSYNGINGTTVSDDAITLNCSKSVGCTNIFLDHINITSTKPDKKVDSTCMNAHGRSSDTIPQVNCLS